MIHEEFKSRMKKLLGCDYTAFIRELECESAVRGVRENLIKSKDNKYFTLAKKDLIPLDYIENGYILNNEEAVGSSPEHHSGMIYMQDPGAMATVCALDIQPQWKVADLCSAPGGKSSQIAERLSKDGFLLSNEYVPKRAKIIVSNFERLGVKNALVSSLDTSELAKMYRNIFDLVLVDAPCSGEGMFRKSEEALSDWSEENIIKCASRQEDILENGSKMVKSGGYLLYSTCTYSIEENEMVVDAFLKRHPEYALCDVKNSIKKLTADGISFEGCQCGSIQKCRRFYPHLSRGEGQFIALMKKDDKTDITQTILYKDAAIKPNKQEMEAVMGFFKNQLSEIPEGRIARVGNNLVLISHGCPIPPHSVFMSGVLVGEVRNGILHPAHHFFSAYGELFKIKENLTKDDQRVYAYLRGEEIPTVQSNRGWCSLMYEGITLGGGKMSDGKIKNHYPKGLRNK